MSFPLAIPLSYDDPLTVYSAQGTTALGVYGMTQDGRLFKYSECGATELPAGLFTTVISTPVNEQTVTVAHAAGTRTVTITSGSTTKDQFKGGYLVVTAGPDFGTMYRIQSNTVDASNLAQFVLENENGLSVAWTTSTDVDLFVNPYSNQIICPVDGQQLAVTLTPRIIPVDNFYWGLVKGLGSFMVDNNAAGAGLEIDEKNINQSLNHAGQGFIDGTPDATALLVGYRQVLGYLVTEEDVVDNEFELAMIDLT